MSTTEPSRKRPKTGGRAKGTPNKFNGELKGMILGALDQAGGVDYLLQRANDPRTQTAFMALVGKVLPMTVQGPGEGGAHTFTLIERRIVGKAHD